MKGIVVAGGIALLLSACAAPAAPSVAPTSKPTQAATPAPTASATAAATPKPSQSPAPSSTAAAVAWAPSPNQSMAAGTYYITNPEDVGVSGVTFTLPEGWTATDTAAKDPGTPGEVMFTLWGVTHVYPDACKWVNADVMNAGTSLDQFMTALAAQKSRTASSVTDTTFDGYPAKQITMTVSPTLDTATCTDGNLRYWPGPGPDFGAGMCCNKAGNIDVVTAVDVSGKRVIVIARHYPGSSEASLAELQSVVDSIQIEP